MAKSLVRITSDAERRTVTQNELRKVARRRVLAGALAGTALLVQGCGPKPVLVPAPVPQRSSIQFRDVTRQAGIQFKHVNGAAGKKWLPETTGSGVAFLDYDNDGYQDILFVNSTRWPGAKGPIGAPKLYHNNGNGTFTDVSAISGLKGDVYGMGATVGDFDNDGFEDVYITAVGPNHLYRNTLGDPHHTGTIFKDVTASAGVAGGNPSGVGANWKWSTSAAWLDYDRDGLLDLFVCNYVAWSPATNIPCSDGTLAGYCPPNRYRGTACMLFHNLGGGRFKDVSKQMGIDTPLTQGKSLGVAVADFNGDGWPDIAVANDTWANFLFINDKGKRFDDQGPASGIALGLVGRARAGMGLDAAAWDNSGRYGLVVGNFAMESLSLYQNLGEGLFADVGQNAGIAIPSLDFLTFGVFWFDCDLDGSLDILAANGHIDDFVELHNSMLTYKERPLLFHNHSDGTFSEIGLRSGLARPIVGRGAAWADLDNHGYADVALVSNTGDAILYRNVSRTGNHWIGLKTVGTRSNRDGIGAEIQITVGTTILHRYVHCGGSYLSDSQHTVVVGLGTATSASRIIVNWPSGTTQTFNSVQGDQGYILKEGQPLAPAHRPRKATATSLKAERRSLKAG